MVIPFIFGGLNGENLRYDFLSMYQETQFRSVLKAISWRVAGTLATAAVVFFLTHKLWIALAAGGADFFSKLGLYFIHERIWNKVGTGKKAIQPAVIWFTGLSGAGKTTLAQELVQKLKARGLPVEHLDGDLIRQIFPQTGFSREQRNEHVKRVGFLASSLERNHVFVVASLISPYRESRDFVRNLCRNFVEVHVSTPIAVCEKRDPKGLYKQAREGKIKNFTGIDDVYEVPTRAELVIDTSELGLDESVAQLLKKISV